MVIQLIVSIEGILRECIEWVCIDIVGVLVMSIARVA